MRIQLNVVDSTNSWAKRNVAQFPRDETVIISAKEQTSGRGRYGNSWISPAGDNLYMTLVQRAHPKLEILDYPQACAIAIKDFLNDYGIVPTIKWPNDVLVLGKKICGILIETTWHREDRYVIMGIGLNCYLDAASHRLISKDATCMTAELKRPVYVLEIEKKVGEYLERTLAEFVTNPEEMRRRYAQTISWMIGKTIRYATGSGLEEGLVVQVLENGCLAIEKSDGSREEISSCEN
jgi:BirA family transcriptional regulator, biotin operon repressor / biotin---[acetyl-CoA-carboxylase] ligase